MKDLAYWNAYYNENLPKKEPSDFAKYLNEDPKIIRIIAQKKK
jgi:hypothetical protein